MKLLAVVRARLRTLASTGRFGRFVSVGAAGASLESVIVALLTAGILADLSVHPLLAKAVGAEASISLMFLLNDRWTFVDEGDVGPRAVLRRYGKSHVVRAGGLAVAFAILFVLTTWTDVRLLVAGASLWPTVANGIAIVVAMAVNYVAESLVTWRIHVD